MYGHTHIHKTKNLYLSVNLIALWSVIIQFIERISVADTKRDLTSTK